MRWIDPRLLAILTAALAMLPAIAQAEVLVVRATGPSASAYPAGRSLADDARLTLRPGDQITLLDDRGTRVLRGPGSFSATGSAAPTNSTALAALVGQRSDRRVRIGAVRGVTPDQGPPGKPNIFYVDTAQSGATCLVDPQSVVLWRADTTRGGTMTLSGSGASAKLQWNIGDATQPWPAELPVGDGASYQLTGPTATSTIRFRILKSAPSGLRDMASALIAADCRGQLDVVIATAEEAG